MISSAFAKSVVVALPLLSVACLAANAETVRSEHVGAELVAERVSAAPGGEIWLGLRLQHAPHWHSYWINPGDSGLPTKLLWNLPEHSYAGDIAWPAPQRFVMGEINNFGYSGEVLLPVRINVPDTLQAGTTLPVEVTAKWLECEEQCIPAKAQLRLDLPLTQQAGAIDRRWNALFDAARRHQPQETPWNGSAILRGERITVSVIGKDLPATAGLDIFPLEPGIVANGAPVVTRSDGALVVQMQKNDYYAKSPSTLSLVFVTQAAPKRRAWRVTVPFREANADPITEPVNSDAKPASN